MKDKSGKIMTSKQDKTRHGLGLESIRSAVKKYDGSVEIEDINGIFKINILVYCSN